MRKLTEKQSLFVKEYVIDGNGAQAAIRAGCRPNSARITAAKWLTKTNIQEAIKKARGKLADKLEITAERVIREMALIAFANSGDYFEWGPGGVSLIAKEKLTRDQMAAVAEVSQSVTEAGGTTRMKLHDKIGALTKLGQHLDVFKDKHEITGKDGEPLLTEEVIQERLELLVRVIETRKVTKGVDAGTPQERLESGDGRGERQVPEGAE